MALLGQVLFIKLKWTWTDSILRSTSWICFLEPERKHCFENKTRKQIDKLGSLEQTGGIFLTERLGFLRGGWVQEEVFILERGVF